MNGLPDTSPGWLHVLWAVVGQHTWQPPIPDHGHIPPAIPGRADRQAVADRADVARQRQPAQVLGGADDVARVPAAKVATAPFRALAAPWRAGVPRRTWSPCRRNAIMGTTIHN